MATSADLLFPGADIQPTLTTINNAILIIYYYSMLFLSYLHYNFTQILILNAWIKSKS